MILTTLCDRGWLTRDPADKTFSLGPAVGLIAERTDVARPVAHAARIAAQQLSREIDYAASVVERVGDSMVITAYEQGDSRERPGIGDRIPYAPPFGVAFAAWDTPMNSAPGFSVAQRRTTFSPNASTACWPGRASAGSTWTGPPPHWLRPLNWSARWNAMGMPPHVREIMDQLVVEYTTIGFLYDDDPTRKAQPIATIAAPVFDERQRVVLIVCVHPLRALTYRQVTLWVDVWCEPQARSAPRREIRNE